MTDSIDFQSPVRICTCDESFKIFKMLIIFGEIMMEVLKLWLFLTFEF